MANVWSFSGVALTIWHCSGWCHNVSYNPGVAPKKRQLFFLPEVFLR